MRLNKQILIQYFFFITIFLGLHDCVEAQSGISKYDYGTGSIHLGLGPSSLGTMNYTFRLDFVDRYGMLMIRVASVPLSHSLRPYKKPSERNTDYGLLYGWKLYLNLESYGEIMTISIASGLAFTRFIRRTDEILYAPSPGCLICRTRYATDNKGLLGIPIELRVGIKRPSAGIGGSVGVWHNFNAYQRFGGVVLGIYIG